MPNAQCPMPNAQCPMPNAQCPMPNTSLREAAPTASLSTSAQSPIFQPEVLLGVCQFGF
jgi:hypothetical protein